MNSKDKATLIKRVSEIEGLNDSERSALLGLLRENKTYGLVWEDKPEAIEERLRDELPILTEVPERAIISEDKDAPNHILIEGDNLEALSTLAYTHAGKIDVIYIDPPYNTGNNDFIYNDSFVDKEDSFRHSKWLSFMSRRLKIAKQLLSDKGVIFISIDDNEQANLKLLCDDVFGKNKYIGTITRKQSSGAKNDIGEEKIITNADYILSYANPMFKFNPIMSENQKNYTRSDVEGPFSPRALEMQGDADTLFERQKMGYSIYYRHSDNSIKLLFDYDINKNPVYLVPDKSLISLGYVCYRPRTRGNSCGRWRWGEDTFYEKFNQNLVHFEKDRVYIKERIKNQIPKYPEAIWTEFLNTMGTTEIKNILGGRSFSFPKPLSLIQQLLRFSKSNTILDFFAGSGTTLHATMQLNADDGGHRKCILVTNNENNICENVTYERNKRVINGYTTPKGEEVAGLKNNNLRYYRTGFVSRSRSVQNMRRLVTLATDMLCIKEDLYTEQAMLGELKTHKNIFRYFDNGEKKMLIIYNEASIEELADAIYGIDYEKKIKIYVFSQSEDPWEALFEDVSEKVELCALPHAIYNAYCVVLPKKRDTMVNPKDDVLYQKEEIVNNGELNFTEEGGEQ